MSSFFIHQQKCPATNVHTLKGGVHVPPPPKVWSHKCSHTQGGLKPRAGNGAIFKEEMLHTLRVLGDIPAESGKVASHHLDWWAVGQIFSEYVTGNGIIESFRNTKIHKSQSLYRKTSMITIRAHFWK